MIEKAVTSVAVPLVDGIAQKCAFFLNFGIPNTLNETIYIRYHNNDAPDRTTQENWINNY